VDALLGVLGDLPPAVVYILLGAGAALENLIPPVPADTFVLVGGFLAGRGVLAPWLVFIVTWGLNVASALGVYGLGHRHGRTFFEVGMGRRVLTPEHLERMGHFYARWGAQAVFLARFLPGLRAVVPAFAGVSHQPFLPVAIPVATASAIWYGALVWLGTVAGRRLDTILAWVGNVNRVLLLIALAITLAVLAWWWRSRRRE
jgi:membrane protein DedA with SNARE-associated domain